MDAATEGGKHYFDCGVFDNFLVILVIEKRSERITKSKFVKLWDWLEYPDRTR